MKEANGTFHSCTSLKSFFNRMGGMISQCNSANKYRRLDPELEKKMVEAIKLRASSRRNSFKSINSIILRFPQYKEGLKTIKSVFEQYDEDSNGTIDRGELKKCLQKLRPHLTDKDIDDLYHSCDIDGHEGIQFTEFVVLLCLTYLLGKPATTTNNTSMLGLPQLETTFETIVEAFLFLDNNCDGKVNKKRYDPCTKRRVSLGEVPWIHYNEEIQGNGLAQEWEGQFQGVPLYLHKLGWI
eukprot:TRINITY_DN36342_c0_g2_i10.p1 TRINITY_DN36342_c0_g2~~TRINITY_DN36342_c0_g2_i10.p1  ORF type:complete len:240 (+),score=38.72 TRINITY_DN36342_c0_g2_i10:1597-2316(+)